MRKEPWHESKSESRKQASLDSLVDGRKMKPGRDVQSLAESKKHSALCVALADARPNRIGRRDQVTVEWKSELNVVSNKIEQLSKLAAHCVLVTNYLQGSGLHQRVAKSANTGCRSCMQSS